MLLYERVYSKWLNLIGSQGRMTVHVQKCPKLSCHLCAGHFTLHKSCDLKPHLHFTVCNVFTCRSFDVAYNTYQNVGLTALNSQAQQQVTFKLYVYYQWLFFLYLYPVQLGYEWAWPLSLSNNLNIKIRLQEKFWPQCWRDEGVKSHNSTKLMRMKNLLLEFHFYIWVLLLYLGQKCGVSLSYHVTN
jgi:hypothetical protein